MIFDNQSNGLNKLQILVLKKPQKKAKKENPKMTNSQVLQHIVKYNLPLSIQGSP